VSGGPSSPYDRQVWTSHEAAARATFERLFRVAAASRKWTRGAEEVQRISPGGPGIFRVRSCEHQAHTYRPGQWLGESRHPRLRHRSATLRPRLTSGFSRSRDRPDTCSMAGTRESEAGLAQASLADSGPPRRRTLIAALRQK
jgi:hypothetical protein